MDKYLLQADEVVLYEGQVELNGISEKVNCILTNLFLVFEIKEKGIFGKTKIKIEKYEIKNIKIYKDIPQVSQKGEVVEIYFIEGKKELLFDKKNNAHNFTKRLLELVTDKTKFERGAEKVKNTISVIDDTLGISVIGTVANIVNNGIVGTIGKTAKKEKGISLIGSKKEVLKLKEPDAKQQTTDEQIETIKKLKELLDEGAITQEEFDLKKKEVMGI